MLSQLMVPSMVLLLDDTLALVLDAATPLMPQHRGHTAAVVRIQDNECLQVLWMLRQLVVLPPALGQISAAATSGS